MSSSAPNSSLSISTRLLCYLGPPSTVLLASLVSPKTGVLSPLAFLPSAWFLKKWRNASEKEPSRRGELEPMVLIYASQGTIGLAATAAVQMLVCYAVSVLLFGLGDTRREFLTEFGRTTVEGLTADELARRARLAVSWQNWIFNGALAFGMAGLIEETLKYLPIAYARRRAKAKGNQQRDRAYIDYALAGAMSFSVIENLGFLYVACQPGHEAWPKLMLTLLERVVVGSTGHILTAALTALRATRRDYQGKRWSWGTVIGPSILLHGAYDFVVMSFSALDGNVGWIHPVGVRNTSIMMVLCSGLVATSAWLVRREWRALENEDRKRQ